MFGFSSLTPGSKSTSPTSIATYLLCFRSTSSWLPMLTSDPTDLIVEELCSDWDILSVEMFRKLGHWPSLVSLFSIHCCKTPMKSTHLWQKLLKSKISLLLENRDPAWFTFLWPPSLSWYSPKVSTMFGTNTQGIFSDPALASSINQRFTILRRTRRQWGLQRSSWSNLMRNLGKFKLLIWKDLSSCELISQLLSSPSIKKGYSSELISYTTLFFYAILYSTLSSTQQTLAKLLLGTRSPLF